MHFCGRRDVEQRSDGFTTLGLGGFILGIDWDCQLYVVYGYETRFGDNLDKLSLIICLKRCLCISFYLILCISHMLYMALNWLRLEG